MRQASNTGLFRGIHACFFNLDVPFCFCILHPLHCLGKYPHRWLACLLPVFTSSDHFPSEQGHSVQGCALSEDLISEFVTSEGAGGDSGEGKTEGSIETERGWWIDGWWEDSQRDDRRWIKGRIEGDCRQKAVWQCYSAAALLQTLPCFGLNTQQSVSTDRLATHTVKHRHYKGETCQYPMSSKFLMAFFDSVVGRISLPGATWRLTRSCKNHWLP